MISDSNPHHLTRRHGLLSLALAAVMALTLMLTMNIGLAQGQTGGGGGGVAPPASPQVTLLRCMTKCIKPTRVAIGAKVKVLGGELQETTAVKFVSRSGRMINGLSLRVIGPGSVSVKVPRGTGPGPVRVVSRMGRIDDSPQLLTIGTKAELIKAQSGWKFPVRGPHTYGDGLGAGRRHMGQDIFARCGTRLVAARGGRVKFKAFQGSAGHYIVIDGAGTNKDFVYMHLLQPALVSRGQSVSTGQLIGYVGQTGNASGCHLHFEMWIRGWYSGSGQVVNPVPYLKYWDSYS